MCITFRVMFLCMLFISCAWSQIAQDDLADMIKERWPDINEDEVDALVGYYQQVAVLVDDRIDRQVLLQRLRLDLEGWNDDSEVIPTAADLRLMLNGKVASRLAEAVVNYPSHQEMATVQEQLDFLDRRCADVIVEWLLNADELVVGESHLPWIRHVLQAVRVDFQMVDASALQEEKLSAVEARSVFRSIRCHLLNKVDLELHLRMGGNPAIVRRPLAYRGNDWLLDMTPAEIDRRLDAAVEILRNRPIVLGNSSVNNLMNGLFRSVKNPEQGREQLIEMLDHSGLDQIAFHIADGLFIDGGGGVEEVGSRRSQSR